MSLPSAPQVVTSPPNATTGAPVPPQAPAPNVPLPADPQISASSSNSQIAPVPSKSRAPTAFSSPFETAVTSAPPMLLCVSNQPFHTTNYSNVTTIVPCFINAFEVLSEMDHLMSTTHRFTSSTPDWIPFVSQLYISTLLYAHTLRAQNCTTHITSEQRLFLDEFFRTFDPRLLRIPGPLVPFFQAITACNGPDPSYGNITFAIPHDMNVTSANAFLPRDRLHLLLPSNIFILDQLVRFLVTNLDVANDHTDDWFSNIFSHAATNERPERIHMQSPTPRSNPVIPRSQMIAFYHQRHTWLEILPVNAERTASLYDIDPTNDAPLDFWQFLGFTSPLNTRFAFHWFDKVATVMQTYSAYFRNTTSIACISPTGLGSIYIETKFHQNDAAILVPAITTRHSRSHGNTARYINMRATQRAATYVHRDPSLEQLAEEYGALTCLSTDWSDIPNAPALATTRSGPIFQRPITRSMHEFSPSRLYGANIATYYHSHNQLLPL